MKRKSLQHFVTGSLLFVTLLLSPVPLREVGGANIDFNSLQLGTVLDKQLAGVTFLTYKGRIRGVVADSPGGRIARFNETDGCEFCPSGAHIVFSALQRTVSVQIGLVPNEGPNVQRDLRLTAFDAAGNVLTTATQNVTAGAGFDTTLTVNTATPEIATVVIEAVDDPNMNAVIGMRGITFDDNPGGGGDFILELPPAMTVLQGGPAMDVPFTVHRFEPSTGGINFSISNLPAGLTAIVIPQPVFGNAALLRLKAASGPVPESKTVIVTGSPLAPSAGPEPRSASIDLTSSAQLQLTGPSDIDLSNCAPEVAHGKVNVDYWVTRDFRISGPIHVTVENLPPDVTATVTPENLTFPGWAIGQKVKVTLRTLAGSNVPDTWIPLHLTGLGVDTSFPILVHGTCPQQNRNFVIRGQFGYLNDQNLETGFQPLNGAQVEIYRYRSDWHDDLVGEVYTDPQGNFSMDLYASKDGDYYARLRLISPEVKLIDADNSSVWSIDTERKSNRDSVIDFGTITISRDGGAGTPRAAVWQGFRNAALEFQCTVGQPVPGGAFDVEIWRGSGPLTFYDEVHWRHGSPTGQPGIPYRFTMHEFGHLFRDIIDGDEVHWHEDDLKYVYGRDHDFCTFSTFTAGNAGFGFHEGWADYWAGDNGCCPGDTDNQNIEGTVAHDLNRLANCG